MKPMTSNEIRASFLQYFERHGHRIVPSSPLVPADDPTLLLTNAGMNQFKDVLLGREKRDYVRATTAQKCMRVSGKHNDLDNVGPSLRHHTFFEMLGNFSFGDYFKKEAIPFAWELLTRVWALEGERLFPTIFKGEAGIPRDDEAFGVWSTLVPPSRITELPASENFWQMGETGPCGRSSEILYFRGNDVPCAEPTCRGLECSCERYVEVWNNVFMEFDRDASGALTPLPAVCVDTGMGLERVTAVIQGKLSNYDTDLFTPILDAIGQRAGREYTGSLDPDHPDVSMRVVADHIRATTFLIADGVMPSNEWRGYVLRKIMRRAMRHGKDLGIDEPFLHRLVAVLDREMGDVYPNLRSNRDAIEKTILAEEKRFDSVLTDGLPKLEAEIARAIDSSDRVLPGTAAFRLYDTFGLPYDFIEDTAATKGVTVDRAGYERAMEGQRDRARASSSFERTTETVPWTGQVSTQFLETDDAFKGYTTTEVRSVPIVQLFDASKSPVAELKEGSMGFVSLKETPFYVESGGQVSDTGRISGPDAEARVHGVIRVPTNRPRAHQVQVVRGTLHVDDIVTAEVEPEVRNATRRNHTATHLLHAALREVLGGHVKQQGSLVAPDRLRFDFVHLQPVTPDERERIERIVNAEIRRNSPVQTDVQSTQDAIAAGAMALFGEKYGDTVRVVSVPGFSKELCGGTHVSATGDIGFFAIVSEGGVAAGVRRIEAVTGAGAVEWAQRQRTALARLIGALQVNEDQAVEAIEKLQTENKRLGRDVTQLKTKLAMGTGGPSDAGDTIEVAGVRLVRRKVADMDKDALRQLADSLKARIKSGIVVIASTNDGKVQIVVSVTPDLTSRIKAGQIVKEIAPIVGGGGGGRPDFAEAGGKQPEKIDAMLAASETVIAKLLA